MHEAAEQHGHANCSDTAAPGRKAEREVIMHEAAKQLTSASPSTNDANNVTKKARRREAATAPAADTDDTCHECGNEVAAATAVQQVERAKQIFLQALRSGQWSRIVRVSFAISEPVCVLAIAELNRVRLWSLSCGI